jgi:MFS family permease
MFSNPVYEWAQKLSVQNWNLDGWYWSFIAAFVTGWLVLFLANRQKNLRRAFQLGLIPLLVGAEFHAFTFGAMAYSAKHEWYWVTQMLALVILGAMGLCMLVDLLQRRKPVQIITWVLTGAASLYMAYGFSAELVNRMPYKDPLEGQPYMDMLPILEGYTEPGALIGMTGGGNAGYFIKDRSIVNMDGLINSYAYFQALKENQGGKYLASIGLDYIFANKYIITNSMPYRQQFSSTELFLVDGAPSYGQKVLMRYEPEK